MNSSSKAYLLEHRKKCLPEIGIPIKSQKRGQNIIVLLQKKKKFNETPKADKALNQG